MSRRIIHTNLYSDKASEYFRYFIELGKYYHTGKINRSLNRLSMSREADNEIVFVIDNTELWSYARTVFYNRSSDDKVLDWFAWLIKDSTFRVCDREGLDPHAAWNRFSENSLSKCISPNETITFSIIIAYCLYDILKNRKGIKNKYDVNLIDELKGQQKDPIATELEIARREEIKRIEEKYKLLESDLNAEFWKKRHDAEDQIREWKETQQAELLSKKNAELQEVNAMSSLM